VFEEEGKTWRGEREKGEKVVLLFRIQSRFRRISIPRVNSKEVSTSAQANGDVHERDARKFKIVIAFFERNQVMI